MRILIANDTYYPHRNGCSYFTQRLAFYLKERGHKILVIAPSKTIHEGFYSHNGIKIFGLRSIPALLYKNFRFAPQLLFVTKSLKKAIKEFDPEVVHIQGPFLICSAVSKIARTLGVPIVGTNHFLPDNLTPYLHLPNKVDKIIHKLVWMRFRYIFNKLDFATAPTKSAGDIFKSIGFKKELRPISNGIDLKIFNPGNNGEYLKKKYRIPNKKILLYVGRLDKEKNIDWIIKAFSIALRKEDVHLIIVGGGSQAKRLRKLTEKLGLKNSVTFTGFMRDCDLPNIYAIADCFAIAGTAELQSIATMEAMASGIPVIAVNSRALPELVSDGENGHLFKTGDIQNLADALIKIFANPDLREQMGKKSLELIQKHDINKSIGEFEAIYKFLQKRED